MAQVRIGRGIVREAMQSAAVRAALHRKAVEVEARAKSIAGTEGLSGEMSVKDGTRPKGRPYSRVTYTNSEQEYGTQFVPKARVLGRAAGF